MSPAGGLVAVAFCHGESVTEQWRRAYSAVVRRDLLTVRRIVGEYDHSSSGVHVPSARSKAVAEFLGHPDRPDWLWIVDTDATFADDVLERLVAAADPVERPIVGALAFGVAPAKSADGVELFSEVGECRLRLFPTLYRVGPDGRTRKVERYARNALVPVDATGCHCLLVHRSVFEHEGWDRRHPLPWFRGSVSLGELQGREPYGNDEVGEDVFFCLTARRLGFPIFVHTGIRTGHVKTFVAGEDAYMAQLGPGTGNGQRCVIVPTRDPVRCREIVAQVLAQRDSISELVVAWNGADSECRVWLESQPITVVDTHGLGIHEMWNVAVDHSQADLVFLNDDVELEPGFFDALFAVLAEPLIVAVSGNYDGRPGSGFQHTGVAICAGRYDGAGGFAGFAFAVKRDWLNATGYRFPTEMRWWCGDNDLVMSVWESGGLAGIALDAHCRHVGGDWSSPELAEQCQRDIEVFSRKWSHALAAV